MTDRLRECPFCGEKVKLLISRNSEGKVQYRIRCHNIDCDVRPSTSWFVCKEEVIERWNRRKPIDRIVEELETWAKSSERLYFEYYEEECYGAWRSYNNAIKIVKREV